MLLPFGCCLQAEVVHCALDESGFAAVTVQPIVHAVEHALQILAVEFVHVPGERRQAAVNGVIHLRVRFVLDLRECGSPRIGRVDRVFPARLRVNGRLVENQGDVAEVAVLHVRARDRDAGHGRAAQREELLQLLFCQVVDGKQRALFLHRIFRGKLDNVRCFCYTVVSRRCNASSDVVLGRLSGLLHLLFSIYLRFPKIQHIVQEQCVINSRRNNDICFIIAFPDTKQHIPPCKLLNPIISCMCRFFVYVITASNKDFVDIVRSSQFRFEYIRII